VYCFQIWLTSAFIAPILYYFWDMPSNPNVGNFLGSCALIAFCGLVLSVPSFCVGWLGCVFLFSRQWAAWVKRILLYLWVSLLTLAPIWLLCRDDDPITLPEDSHLALCFLIAVFLTLGWYRWPDKKTS
jgi:hypothetical protein